MKAVRIAHVVSLLESDSLVLFDVNLETSHDRFFVVDAVADCGSIPPGNVQGEDKWKPKKPKRVKQELKLTPGKGIEDLLCSIEDLVKQVVTAEKVYRFHQIAKISAELHHCL